MGPPKPRTPTRTHTRSRSTYSNPPNLPTRPSIFSRIALCFRRKKTVPKTEDSDSDLYKGDVEIDDNFSPTGPMRMLSPRSTEAMPVTPRKKRTISFGISPRRGTKREGKGGGGKGEAERGVRRGDGKSERIGTGDAVETAHEASNDPEESGADVTRSSTHKDLEAVPEVSRKAVAKGRDEDEGAGAEADTGAQHDLHAISKGPAKTTAKDKHESAAQSTVQHQQPNAIIGLPAQSDSSDSSSSTSAIPTPVESPAPLPLRRQSPPKVPGGVTPASPGQDAALRSHPVAGLDGSDSSDGMVYTTPVSKMSSAKSRPMTM